jgi:hypothetical protein
MAEVRALGLEYIKVGDVGATGGMGETLAALGVTYKDTAELVQADAEVTEFFSEENDDPEEEISKRGVVEVRWSIINYSPEEMVKVLGGTVSGTAPNDSWEAPATQPDIEKSIQIKDKVSGRILQIPRAKVTAKLNWKLARTGIAMIDIVAKVLTPTDGTTKSIKWLPDPST